MTELVGKVVVVQALTLFFFVTPSIGRWRNRRRGSPSARGKGVVAAFFTTVVLSIVSLTVTCEALLGGFCTDRRAGFAAALTLSNILLTVALVFQTVALKRRRRRLDWHGRSVDSVPNDLH